MVKRLLADVAAGKAAVAASDGAVPLEADLGHLADGSQSDGVEALMTPKLLNGIRQKQPNLGPAALLVLSYTAK